MSPASNPKSAPMRPYERWGSVLSHLSTIVPIWAIVANALLFFSYRESSRVVCFHARQGINFQVLFLLAWLAHTIVALLVDLLRTAGLPNFATDLVDRIINFGMLAAFIVYAIICLVGAFHALKGRIFVYPLAGKRLYQNFAQSSGMNV